MRKGGSFVGGLGGQVTLILEDKREGKVNYDLAKIQWPNHDERILGSVYTLLYSALIQGNTADSEFLGK